ncbi:unnamed protein product [Larinioides sclopetarius]|uniref:Uncharacterized protein n=1 Tax=Larinioides sclopetarius TaxID=280406 RepID=A0AAV2AXQ4_9ARAC
MFHQHQFVFLPLLILLCFLQHSVLLFLVSLQNQRKLFLYIHYLWKLILKILYLLSSPFSWNSILLVLVLASHQDHRELFLKVLYLQIQRLISSLFCWNSISLVVVFAYHQDHRELFLKILLLL